MTKLNLNRIVRDIGTALKTPAVRTALKNAEKQIEAQIVRDVQRWADGFQAARTTAPKTVTTSPSSTASDTAFITSLYKDILGRSPDIGGFNAHLSALQSGATREQVRQAFLNSDEYKAKSAPVAAPVDAPEVAPTAPAQLTGVDQLKALIAADIRTAGKREATDADYAYWLPKLQEPCDSGFVTSGQMTGVEYYHRRMLGWQAGGSDMAIAGPYAGSPDRPISDVPSAESIVGRIKNPSNPDTEMLRKLIASDIRLAGNREATDADYAYWLPKLQSPCDSGFVTSGQMTGVEYYHRRMLGWQAGGSDMAVAGPYAGSPDAHGPVPSAVDVMGGAEIAPSAPTSPTVPVATPSMTSTEQLRKLIAADMRMAGNREATDADYAYWLPMLQSPCDSGFVTSGQMTGVEYYHRRMLGWQAGGSDMAIAGPYAGSPDARGPVPSAVDIVGELIAS